MLLFVAELFVTWQPPAEILRIRNSVEAKGTTCSHLVSLVPVICENVISALHDRVTRKTAFGVVCLRRVMAPHEALVEIPDSLSDVDAAPLMCAGITTYNSLRHCGALPGDLVAIEGIGGLGHLAVQFAHKFGYRVAAIGRGPESAALAKKLGASVYIDGESVNAAEELQKIGGARVILATAPSSKAMTELVGGLSANGKMILIGVSFDPLGVAPVQLIVGRKALQGWPSGTPADEEDTLRFCELSGIRPMIETFPLEEADAAYARMMSGKARFRVVLKI
jgi:D-arabinose 1-dehydrogenase-like Zn-dependent alcohol dehydrogenase